MAAAAGSTLEQQLRVVSSFMCVHHIHDIVVGVEFQTSKYSHKGLPNSNFSARREYLVSVGHCL